MAGEQAFSPSMDEMKQEQGSQQSDEMWSELSNPRGREFDLPNLTNPVSTNESDNNVDLAVSSFELFDVPIELDQTSQPAIADSSSGGNLTDSFQILENLAPSVGNACLKDDYQSGPVEENNHFDVPITDGLSLKFDIDAFLRNQVVESSDLPALSSIISQHRETDPTNGPSFMNGCMFGSGILQRVKNQSKNVLVRQNSPWSGSNDFSNSHAYFSSRNEEAHIPVTSMGNSFNAQTHNYVVPVDTNNLAYGRDIPMTVPTPMNNDRDTQAYPLSNLFGPGQNGQPVGLGLFQVGHTSSLVSDNGTLKYSGNDGEQKFTSYDAFGVPGGFHEKPIFNYFNSGTISTDALPTRQSELAHPWVATDSNAVENYFLNKGKEKMPIHLTNESARAKRPLDADIEKQEWGQFCKRFKQGSPELDNTAENKACPFNSPTVEGSSRAVVSNVLAQALEVLKNIPSQGMLRPKQLVFKEPSNSKNPEK